MGTRLRNVSARNLSEENMSEESCLRGTFLRIMSEALVLVMWYSVCSLGDVCRNMYH